MKDRKSRALFATKLMALTAGWFIIGLYVPELPVIGTEEPYPIPLYVLTGVTMWVGIYAIPAMSHKIDEWLTEDDAKTADELDTSKST